MPKLNTPKAPKAYCTDPICCLRATLNDSIFRRVATGTTNANSLVYKAPEVITRKVRSIDPIRCPQTKIPIPVSHGSRCGIYRGCTKHTPTSKNRTISYSNATNPASISLESSIDSSVKLVPLELFKSNEIKQEVRPRQSRARSEVCANRHSVASSHDYYISELQKSIDKLEKNKHAYSDEVALLKVTAPNVCFYDIKIRDDETRELAYKIRPQKCVTPIYAPVPIRITEDELIHNKLTRACTPIYQRIQSNLRSSSQQMPARVSFRSDPSANEEVWKKAERTGFCDVGKEIGSAAASPLLPLSASSRKLSSSMSRLYFKNGDSRRLSQPLFLSKEDDPSIQVEYAPSGDAVTVDVSLKW